MADALGGIDDEGSVVAGEVLAELLSDRIRFEALMTCDPVKCLPERERAIETHQQGLAPFPLGVKVVLQSHRNIMIRGLIRRQPLRV